MSVLVQAGRMRARFRDEPRALTYAWNLIESERFDYVLVTDLATEVPILEWTTNPQLIEAP